MKRIVEETLANGENQYSVIVMRNDEDQEENSI
jgi:hypothetical protein